MEKKTKPIIILGILVILAMFIVLIVSITSKARSNTYGGNGGKTLDELEKKISIHEATPTKGVVSLDNNNLYDELPDINKYPLAISGKGDIDIEIFTSGEKAGKGNDSWLIDVAEQFNKGGHKLANGKTVSMSVRSVASGTAADYIISNKYVPDIYTPSNTLFGEYAMANGGDLELYEERLVGNTAGILVKKGTYSDFGTENFTKFNANIPYVAYTTQQMRDSASNGSLDGMLTEYQAYINDSNLTSVYDFIPFGVRHDNPAFICNPSSKTQDEMDAIKIVIDFCKSSEMQKIATSKGFNANDDYTSSLSFSGAEVTQGLETYKKEKDNGRDIIAVFVADCSGSMDGEPMSQLKSSLSNGMSYINDNNYIGLVSYDSDVTIELPIAQMDLNQRSYFQGAIDNLYANGSTSTYEALVVAAKMVEAEKVNHPDAKCMIILLSDGYANGNYELNDIQGAIRNTGIPIHTISYGDDADKAALGQIANINEAATINADSDDIVYKLKSLFNSEL